MNKNYVSKKCIGLFAALIIFVSAACFTSYAYDFKKDVRVGINHSTSALETVIVKNTDNTFIIDIEGYNSPFEFPANTLVLKVYDGNLNVKTLLDNNIVCADTGVKIMLYPKNTNTGLTVNDQHYYGGFEFYADNNGKIAVINVINIDDYIKGVLPSEIYPSWHIEALKAAAVVSRTYGLKNAMASSHSSAGFDICSTTHCQMYEGTKKENANTNAAIEATKGLVIVYNGALATTPYHSSTGGYTASAAEVWGGKRENYPYLTNVFNPYENYRNVPNGKWHSVVIPENLLKFIPASYKDKLPGGNLTFEYDKSKIGYIDKMTVVDSVGNSVTMNTADKVRSFFGSLVKSANFGIANSYIPSDTPTAGINVISAAGEYQITGINGYEYITANGVETTQGLTEVLVFDGSGYGHGVGMSQFGTRDLANAGFTYDEIISTYFPGTEIVSVNE